MSRLAPVNIVTGFLGSGKTTLIQHLLQHGLNGERVAVVVNDIAEYNVDGRVLKGLNVDKMVQLTSGCICCSGAYQMGLAIQEIVETVDPSLILIETSGAAAPGPVVAELGNLGYRTDAVITLVDSERFLSLAEVEPVITEQVEEGDFLVLNKLDLVDPRRASRVRSRLERINPRALTLETAFGRVSPDLLFATGIRKIRQRSAAAHSHPDPIGHFTYKTTEPMDPKRLARFLARLPREIYRLKGFLMFQGEDYPRLLNYVCGRYILEPFLPLLPPERLSKAGCFETNLVFVGREIDTHRKKITKALDRCSASFHPSSLIHRILAQWGR